MRYAVIDDGTKVVVNVIELEDGADWSPPTGCSLVTSETGEPGGTYKNRAFTQAPKRVNTRAAAQQAYAAATTDEERIALIAKQTGLIPNVQPQDP